MAGWKKLEAVLEKVLNGNFKGDIPFPYKRRIVKLSQRNDIYKTEQGFIIGFDGLELELKPLEDNKISATWSEIESIKI